jgi:hypothetical protein
VSLNFKGFATPTAAPPAAASEFRSLYALNYASPMAQCRAELAVMKINWYMMLGSSNLVTRTWLLEGVGAV